MFCLSEIQSPNALRTAVNIYFWTVYGALLAAGAADSHLLLLGV